MPVRELGPPQPTPVAAELMRRLADEWRDPGEGPSRPEIWIDRRAETRPVRIYVVWEAWSELSQRERSEIIMNAYEQVNGSEEARQVLSAMGLTPAESQRLGIPLHSRV